MKAQRTEIESRLAQHGWNIAEVEDGSLEWWAHEIWRLESAWSPTGARAYLTWLVDPQNLTPNRKKEQGVWAVKASAVKPVGWLDGAGEYTLSLRHGWKDELPRLFEHLATLRDQGSVTAR